MNITRKTIALWLITIIHYNCCMQTLTQPTNTVDITAAQLLDNKALNLTNLLAIETQGQFCPQLLHAEKTLSLYLQNENKKNLKNLYNRETLTFAKLISERPVYKKYLISLFKDENENESYRLKKIINLGRE